MQADHLEIINITETKLPDCVKEVLAVMFVGYSQVIVKSKFQSGFSGSHVFLVRPVKSDGAELPAVVKIDHIARIEKEWQAYKSCIQYKLPNVAEVRGDPVYLQESEWGGLWYPLVGAGTFEIESLRQYIQKAGIEDICYTLETRLFKSLGVLWRHTRTVQPYLHLKSQYDSFLPMNLMIELGDLPSGAQPKQLNPENISHQKVKSGDHAQLSGFQVVKIITLNDTQKKLSLDLPSDSQTAYRLQVYPVPNSTTYKVGDIIQDSLTGIIRHTRQELLQKQVTASLGAAAGDLSAATLRLRNNSSLPNPLHELQDILNHSFDAHVSYIHGDLNLENILVDVEIKTAFLIDFAQARKDHTLRDLFHLEMSIVTQLVSSTLRENGLAWEAICSFYEQLHCAVLHPGEISAPAGLEKPFAILLLIRQTAKRYLFDPDDWREYFYGLALYLLGSLRYPNLNKIPGAKAVAFWGTAVTLKLLQSDPPCQPKAQESSQSTRPDSHKPTTETHFYGPVTGPVHSGSGNINISHSSQPEKPQPEPKPRPKYNDLYSPLENGLERLVAHIGASRPRYGDALLFQQRLTENINRTRRYGDTNLRQADRAEIIDQLNELALSTTGKSFNELCQET